MTGIENITGRIQADAQAEIDRIDADARAQADKITAAYAARAERECADILERGAKSAAERGDRLVSAAQMEARRDEPCRQAGGAGQGLRAGAQQAAGHARGGLRRAAGPSWPFPPPAPAGRRSS